MTDDGGPDMGEIRGEKVIFRKQDIASLEAMPSAKATNGVLVRSPRRRSPIYVFARVLMSLMLLATLGVAGLIYAIEKGVLDDTLTRQAADALNQSLAPDFAAHVGSAGMRLGKDGRLAIEAQDVTISRSDTKTAVVEAGIIQLSLSPLSLLAGEIKVSSAALEAIHFDSASLGSGVPFDAGTLKIADVPVYLDQFYNKLDEVLNVILHNGTKTLLIKNSRFSFLNAQARVVQVTISSLNLLKNDADHVSANGIVLLDDKAMHVNFDAGLKEGKFSSAKLFVTDADITPLSLAYNLAGMKRDGFNGSVSIEASLVRTDNGRKPLLTANIRSENSLIFVDGHGQELTSGQINLLYNFDKKRIEIGPSDFYFETTHVPLEGAVMDFSVDASHPDSGFAISMLASNGLVDVKASGEKPLAFDLGMEGEFIPKSKTLTFRKLLLSTPGGAMAGSAVMRFEGLSPEISFAAEADILKTQTVKQLWPYWIASKVRKWAFANVFDGQITKATIEAFIPQDRMYLASGHMDLDEKQLKLAFDADDLRLNIPGEFPPLRDLAGHLDMKGGKVSIAISKGNAFMPSGRTAAVEQATFNIDKSHVRPLIADVDVKISGDVDALAELVSYKPIDGLKTTEYKADDFQGSATAKITARFGLIKEQNPPEPDWKAEIELANAGLAKPVSGHKIGGVEGTLVLNPSSANLKGEGKIDGIDLTIDATVPTKPGSSVKKEISISGNLAGKDLKTLAPGLMNFVQGSLGVDFKQSGDDDQKVKLDLSNTSLTVPWIGWSKGSGVPAKAAFSLASVDGVTAINDLAFTGDGFGLAGKLEIGKQGLNSASFTSVKLSSTDNFALTIKKKNEDYRVAVTGKSIDLRPLLAKLKTQTGTSSNDTSNLLVNADIDRASGFHDETVSNLKLEYGSNSGALTRLALSAVSDSGQAIVANLAADGDGKSVQLTAGDAGALARFADVYKNMQNGLMNMRLKQRGPGSWVGNIDIRKFQLLNEDRLQTIVSTPAGENGKSLNQAVKRDIDVRSEKFARGFASLAIKNGVIQIDNGVVRGEQVGATFQGTVRDADGNTDMTGTFMPAYGLNRLFAELPLIGIILGNGRDRGLLGITFKLTGPFEKPQLIINPLSLIAPGVFRSIFEFQ